MTTRIGQGFDAHRFVEGRDLVLGGVGISHSSGLAGHSDADVLCHAVMDALLGAIASGDIGTHFPDTDPEWEGANSMSLLESVGDMVGMRGGRIMNVDSTVIAESPKLAPHIADMRLNISAALGISVESVSVKATTVEGMGAIGRKEGIAAMAIVLVELES